ncbi:MAG TPA: TonB-dependent receptor [Candidatus Prevotella stercoripullorum]|nr:TonB-dependent receptor [Candidatus Prevotella stercoripullorum]
MKQVKFKTSVRLMSLLLGLFLSVGAFAQNDVKGIVKDASGEPIIGATIRVVGQDGGAITDFDGNFTVKAAPGAKIQVSYIGYKTVELPVSANMIVTLQDDTQLLSDVVVIGYGRAKKEDLTGSVTAIKPDEMSKGITSSASDMLVGKIAGVDVITAGGSPGSGAQIRIRGGSSLNASNDPLIVVDGLTIDNNTATGMSNVMAMINPNDIETFTVLKDASATAIYGSRASNGVIIITTKKGRKGTGPKFSYNGDVTISTTQKRYDVLNGNEYRALANRLWGEGNAPELGKANTDWQDEIFRTAVSTSHNLSITGGLKNMPYRVSAGYQSDSGIIKNSYMKRFNASVNLAPSFFDDHLNFNVTAKFMAEKDSYVDAGAVVGGALAMDPTRPVYYDGPGSEFVGGYYQYLQTTDAFPDKSWNYTTNTNTPSNPVALLNQKSCIANASDFTGNIEMDYKIHGFEDLHIHASFGGQYTSSTQDDYTSPYSYDNNYYGWNGVTKYYKYSITANAYAQYQHTFGAHNIDVMVGGEESHYHRNGWNAGSGWDSYNNVAYNETLKSEQEWATHNSLVSYFGRLNYTLLDRYMLTATFRADGSSRFAKGHKWGYFPSVALAWRINDEKFMKPLKWWNEFKLRLGWGQTGQQDIGSDFLYQPVYTIGDQYGQYQFGTGSDSFYYTVRPSAYNPDLTWETTTTWNAGLDFAFLNNRITANIDGYYRKTTDLIQDVTIPVGMNFAQRMSQNIGSLENYGIEFSIGAKPIVTKDFTWDIQYNVSWNHNEITELIGGDDEYIVESGGTISRGNSTHVQAHKVGEPANSFWVYQQVYDENGKPLEGVFVDRDGNGIISNDDRYFYHSPAAPVYMGLTMKFLYKNWDLSFALRSAIGNYVYYDFLANKAVISTSGLYSNSAYSNTTQAAVDLGFTGTGTGQPFLSDYFVRNASYLKCQNITLGYSFPALLKYNNQDYFSGRVFLTVQNPFIITKYKGLDPEISSGIDNNPYPRPMSFQLGLNLNF